MLCEVGAPRLTPPWGRRWASAIDDPRRQGTTVTEGDQTKETDEHDALELAVPDRVSSVMSDIAEDLREGLLAQAVGCRPASEECVDERRHHRVDQPARLA